MLLHNHSPNSPTDKLLHRHLLRLKKPHTTTTLLLLLLLGAVYDPPRTLKATPAPNLHHLHRAA